LREHEDDGVVVLDAAVRSFPPVEPFGLRWQFPLWLPDSAIDPTALRGKQTGSEQRQAERDQQGINKIIGALLHWTAADGQATERKLRAKTKLSKHRVQKLLDQLVEDKQIIANPINIRGNQTNEYRLPDDAE
jgi:hypothetical protein